MSGPPLSLLMQLLPGHHSSQYRSMTAQQPLKFLDPKSPRSICRSKSLWHRLCHPSQPLAPLKP
jgi:hypothetical protein